MKWKTTSLPLCVASVLLLLGCCYACMLFLPKWTGFVPGFACMLAAIPVHKLAKGRPFGYCAAILLNAAGSGLVMGVYYAWRGVRFGVFEAAVAAACVLATALASVLLAVWRHRKWASVGMGVLLLVLLVWSVVCWCTADVGLFSLLFFALLFAAFWSAGLFLSWRLERAGRLRYISMCMFWAFGVIALVVVIVLSEGDVIGDFASGLGPDPRPRSKG